MVSFLDLVPSSLECPKGFVLDLLLFIVYINNLEKDIKSKAETDRGMNDDYIGQNFSVISFARKENRNITEPCSYPNAENWDPYNNLHQLNQKLVKCL